MAGKARVHELAKELGVTSKEVLARLGEQGEFVKSASSTVEAPVARRLRESFGGNKTDKVKPGVGASNGSPAKPAPSADRRPGPRPGPPAPQQPKPAAPAAPAAAAPPAPGPDHGWALSRCLGTEQV